MKTNVTCIALMMTYCLVFKVRSLIDEGFARTQEMREDLQLEVRD